MSKIRKLYYFDKNTTQEMISFLNNSSNETYINHIMFNPLIPLHHLIPLRFKFLPESYILKDKKDVKGLITVAPSICPLKKMEIQKLLFEQNCYEAGGELIQYVVSKYKAKGVTSFIVRVDDYLPELIKLFVSRCGFSQLSYEKLWRAKPLQTEKYDRKAYRSFRNTDAQAVANLYNESLLPHFRLLLGRDPKEFKETVFKGLSYFSEYKFVIEDPKTKNITGYISIRTNDNENYIVDITQSSWVDIDINSVISFASSQIQKRKKNFNLFIKTKKYTQLSEKYEQTFIDNKFECVQTQVVLTHTSARIIKDTTRSGNFTVLNQFYGLGAVN